MNLRKEEEKKKKITNRIFFVLDIYFFLKVFGKSCTKKDLKMGKESIIGPFFARRSKKALSEALLMS